MKIDNLTLEHNNKVISYDSKFENLEKEAKDKEDMVNRFEQRLFEAKDQALEEEKGLEDIKSKSILRTFTLLLQYLTSV